MRGNEPCLLCRVYQMIENETHPHGYYRDLFADLLAIEQHIANGHTEHCARQLIQIGSTCICGVENFELRDPMELLETINRLTHGAL